MKNKAKEIISCEHKDCKNKATWRIKRHAFGLVTFDSVYCDEHFNLHISAFKLTPSEDIVRL